MRPRRQAFAHGEVVLGELAGGFDDERARWGCAGGGTETGEREHARTHAGEYPSPRDAYVRYPFVRVVEGTSVVHQ